jgi:hypothetical protein
MRKLPGKTAAQRLDACLYREVHRQILERDSWRCQICGNMQSLQVHHLRLRSQSGGDEERNLITLCALCHEKTHRGPCFVGWPQRLSPSSTNSSSRSSVKLTTWASSSGEKR